jgi:hypothetical protein
LLKNAKSALFIENLDYLKIRDGVRNKHFLFTPFVLGEPPHTLGFPKQTVLFLFLKIVSKMHLFFEFFLAFKTIGLYGISKN